MYNAGVFAEKVPSVFVINSPFQAFCAIAAIKNLKIHQYRLIVCLNNDSRDCQMKQLLNSYNVHYQFKRMTLVNKFCFLIKALIRKNCCLQRLFIGDVRCIKLYLIGIGLISDHSDIVCIDDGIMTISFLSNKIKLPLIFGIVTLISSYRGMNLLRNFYTIYDNMPDEVYQKWNIKTNVFQSFGLFGKFESKNLVSCIIGTNSIIYCSYLNLSIDYYYAMLENLFIYITHRRPFYDVEYYAHGRDNNEYIKALCKKYGVIYISPSKIVELSLLEKGKYPHSIWGFTSSALYNLRKLFPNSQVYNVRLHSNVRNAEMEEYDFLTAYYERNGITTKYLPITC